MTHKRWYDFDQRLSMVVRAMEFMNLNSQQRFAQKLLDLSEVLLKENGGAMYIADLDEKRLEGLSKATSNRKRWYDRYETLHQAFNNLYALPNADRRAVAAQLATPIEIVAGYEKHCKQLEQEPDIRVVEEILRSSFREGADRTRKLYAIYLSDHSGFQDPRTTSPSPADDSKNLWASLLQNIKEALTTV